MDVVARNLVAAEAVVPHRRDRELTCRQGRDAMMDFAVDGRGEVIGETCPNEDKIPGGWHGRGMGDVLDKGRNIHLHGGIGGARRSPGGKAGGPVLGDIIAGREALQFEGAAAPVGGVEPGPTVVAIVLGAASAGGPVAAVGIADAVDLASLRVKKPEGLTPI